MGMHHHAGLFLAAGMFIVASAAHPAEESRELGPHVHGRGTLAIAIETNDVQMEFSAPGMDIVGFEHEADTARQKKAVQAALADLREPLKLFALPDHAECTVTSADVTLMGGDREDHGAAVEADEAVETDQHESGHAEFRATYALTCGDASQITSMDSPYFDRFRDAEGLDVTIVDANGETAFEVSREARRVER